MLLGLPPARYVVLPHYESKLKQLLETANDVDAGLPLEYEVTTLQVSTMASLSMAGMCYWQSDSGGACGCWHIVLRH